MSYTDSDGQDIFGPGFSWTRLYERALFLVLRPSYRRGQAVDDRYREVAMEATTEGWLHVREQWVHRPSSLTDDLSRNWAYALSIVVKRARMHLARIAELAHTELVVTLLYPDSPTASYSQAMDDIFGADRSDFTDYIQEKDLHIRASRVLAALAD